MEATLGQRVFIRDGVIEGPAPALTYVEGGSVKAKSRTTGPPVNSRPKKEPPRGRLFWRCIGDNFLSSRLQVTSKRSDTLERPYLRVANVLRGTLDLSEIKRIRLTESEHRRTQLAGDDIP